MVGTIDQLTAAIPGSNDNRVTICSMALCLGPEVITSTRTAVQSLPSMSSLRIDCRPTVDWPIVVRSNVRWRPNPSDSLFEFLAVMIDDCTFLEPGTVNSEHVKSLMALGSNVGTIGNCSSRSYRLCGLLLFLPSQTKSYHGSPKWSQHAAFPVVKRIQLIITSMFTLELR
jgi:hypothetical protein